MLGVLAGVAALSWQANAQMPQTVIRSHVNLVHVPFAAFDNRGRHIAGLTTGDVEIYEDGARQSIEYFRQQSDPALQTEPLSIILMMDTSGSVKDKLELEQAIAIDFLRKMLRPGQDQAAIVQFDTRVTRVEDFTDDIDLLDRALRSLAASGTTALYEAVHMAAERMFSLVSGRKVMVIVSDGEDTSSKIGRHQAVEAAQRNDVTIFTVGINTQGYRSEFASLKDFGWETGGHFFSPKLSVRELSRVFRDMADTIKQHYNVFYYSTNQRFDGSFRAIEVRVRKKKARVQHRLGYYAPRRGE